MKNYKWGNIDQRENQLNKSKKLFIQIDKQVVKKQGKRKR